MAEALLQAFRGTEEGGRTYPDYPVPEYEGMAVLDAVYYVQATSAPVLSQLLGKRGVSKRRHALRH